MLRKIITAITKEQVETSLNKKFKGNEEIIGQILSCDPTPNHGYSIWVSKLLLNNSIRLPEDAQKINEKLQLFEELKKRGKIKGVDINQVKSYGDLARVVEQAEETKTKGEQYRENLTSGATEVFNDSYLKVIKVTTPEAAMELSKGTEWCTAGSNMAEHYVKQSPLYVFMDAKTGQKLAQYHEESNQFMDTYDEEFECPDKYSSSVVEAIIYLGLKLVLNDKIIELFCDDYDDENELVIDYLHNNPKAAFEVAVMQEKSPFQKASKDLTDVFKNDAKLAYEFALYSNKQSFPDGEPVISKSPREAKNYAIEIIRGRWPEGEPAIFSDGLYAYYYINFLINNRRHVDFAPDDLKPIESQIARWPDMAAQYAVRISNERFPLAEPAMSEMAKTFSRTPDRPYPWYFKEYEEKFGVNLTNEKQASILSRVVTAISKEQVESILQKKFKGDKKIINQVLACDPTPNHGYGVWVAKLLLNKSIRLPEDTQKINEKLQLFEELKKRGKIKSVDINQLKNYGDLAEVVEKALDTKTKGETYRENLVNGAEEVYNDGDVKVIKVTTPEAAMELSKGTEWCTAGSDMATQYTSQGPLYMFADATSGEKLALYHCESGQFKSIRDVGLALADNGRIAERVKKAFFALDLKMSSDAEEFGPFLDEMTSINPLHSPATALYYLENYDPFEMERRGFEIDEALREPCEKLIATDAKAAYYYAKNVIKGRWPEGESVISRDARWACYYAIYILKKRFPEAEPAIAQDAHSGYNYAKHIIKGRWPEAEPVIVKDAEFACYYADDIMKGRWPEAEPFIAQDAGMAYWYTNLFPDAKQDIIKYRKQSKSANSLSRVITAISKEQVVNSLKKKFPENPEVIEQIIQSDPTDNKAYSIWIAKLLLNKRIILPEDSQKIHQGIGDFIQLRKTGKIPRNVDINQLKSFSDLARAVDEAKAKTKTKKEEREENKVAGKKLVWQDSEVDVFEISTPEAAQVVAEDTSWCVSSYDTAASYLKQSVFYYIALKDGEPVALLHQGSDQIKDKNDAAIGEYESDAGPYIENIKKFVDDYLGMEEEDYSGEFKGLYTAMSENELLENLTSTRLEYILGTMETNNASDGEYYDYSADYPYREGFYVDYNTIAQLVIDKFKDQPYVAANFLYKIIQSDLTIISSCRNQSIEQGDDEDDTLDIIHSFNTYTLASMAQYCSLSDILENSKMGAELDDDYYDDDEELDESDREYRQSELKRKEAIVQENRELVDKALKLAMETTPPEPSNKDNFSKAKNVATSIYEFANQMGERYVDGEKYIIAQLDESINYASLVINGRWPELESAIVNQPKFAASYAMSVLHERWPEAEPVIVKDLGSADKYCRKFFENAPWPEYEHELKAELSKTYDTYNNREDDEYVAELLYVCKRYRMGQFFKDNLDLIISNPSTAYRLVQTDLKTGRFQNYLEDLDIDEDQLEAKLLDSVSNNGNYAYYTAIFNLGKRASQKGEESIARDCKDSDIIYYLQMFDRKDKDFSSRLPMSFEKRLASMKQSHEMPRRALYVIKQYEESYLNGQTLEQVTGEHPQAQASAAGILHRVAGEPRRQVTAISKEQMANALKKKFPENPEMIEYIFSADPTENKAYSVWIAKLVLRKNVRMPEDAEKISRNLTEFKELRKQNKIQRNIDVNALGSYAELATIVNEAKAVTQTKKEIRQQNKIEGKKLVYSSDGLEFYEISTPEAAQEVAKGTEWCVSNWSTAVNYLQEGPFYYITTSSQSSGVMEGNQPLALLHVPSEQLKDTYDAPVTSSGILYAVKQFLDHIGITFEEYGEDLNAIFRVLPPDELWNSIDSESVVYFMLQSNKEAYGIYNESDDGFQEEHSNFYDYNRILDVLPDGDDANRLIVDIVGNIADIGRYATDDYKESIGSVLDFLDIDNLVLAVEKDCFNEMVDAISAPTPQELKLIKSVVDTAIKENPFNVDPANKQPWESDVETTENICHQINKISVSLKKRYKSWESYVLNDAQTAYQYSNEVIKGRWPEAEAVIMKSPKIAVNYAHFKLKTRWPEAEPYIATNAVAGAAYKNEFRPNEPWPELDATIINTVKNIVPVKYASLKSVIMQADNLIDKLEESYPEFLSNHVMEMIDNPIFATAMLWWIEDSYNDKKRDKMFPGMFESLLSKCRNSVAQDANCSYEYAMKFDERFAIGEPAMAREFDAQKLIDYCNETGIMVRKAWENPRLPVEAEAKLLGLKNSTSNYWNQSIISQYEKIHGHTLEELLSQSGYNGAPGATASAANVLKKVAQFGPTHNASEHFYKWSVLDSIADEVCRALYNIHPTQGIADAIKKQIRDMVHGFAKSTPSGGITPESTMDFCRDKLIPTVAQMLQKLGYKPIDIRNVCENKIRAIFVANIRSLDYDMDVTANRKTISKIGNTKTASHISKDHSLMSLNKETIHNEIEKFASANKTNTENVEVAELSDRMILSAGSKIRILKYAQFDEGEAEPMEDDTPVFNDDYSAIEYIETGENRTDEGVVAAFQQLINSGTVWNLQGSYSRTAENLIEQGLCHEPNNNTGDDTDV